MKKYAFCATLLLVLCAVITTSAQPPTLPKLGNSPYWGLNSFLNSDFMTKFEECRTRAEQSVIDFKRIQNEFSEEDRQKVMDAYNASANKFNDILYQIKTDLLDRNKRKFIIQYPDAYAKQIETDLNRAKDFYAANYQTQLQRVTDGRITGSALIVLLPEIIKYGQLAFQIFKQLQGEIKKYQTDMLDAHLFVPYKFHAWGEL